MRTKLLKIAIALLLAATPLRSTPASVSVTATEFDAKAFAALPIEQPYAFQRALEQGQDAIAWRDPTARPGVEELSLASSGWKLIIPANAGTPLHNAAEDLAGFLVRVMNVRLTLESSSSMTGRNSLTKTIIAAPREMLAGCGGTLTGPKDYQITVTAERVVVCGFDERGAMFGLYHLEERMALREAPFLPLHLDTVRHSLYKARMTVTGLGWMEWPDNYLAILPRYGIDAIYASLYANPNGVPATPPEYDRMRTNDPAAMHELIHHAAAHGLDVYTPIMYVNQGDSASEAGLRKLVRDVATEFPQIRGYVLLTEGFLYKSRTAEWPKSQIRDYIKGWTRGVAIAAEEFHKINPAIEVLPWDYNVDFSPQAVDLKRFLTSQLPLDSIPLVTFENGTAFDRGGERGHLKDYSISEIGPSEVTQAQIAEARRRGMPGVYAKADTWATWQYGTFPYLPFPYQWYARYQAIQKSGVDGTMESWSYGFKPNYVAELRGWYSWSDAPPLDALLRQIARREFGPHAEAQVLSGWDHFSRAIRLVPDTGWGTMGTSNAVAAPFFFSQPEPRTLTYLHSFWDQKAMLKDADINPYWPYVPTRFILFPDFTNRVNEAEAYAKPFTLPVFTRYLLAAADEMERGLESYRAAALAAPAVKRLHAFREVLLAEQIERMMRSEVAVLQFEDMRFHLAAATGSEQSRLLDRMTALLKEEIPRTEAARETALRDSRLGYEWEQDYLYSPRIMEEKLKLLRKTLRDEIPAYGRTHNIPFQ
jgi:hypothetical protein